MKSSADIIFVACHAFMISQGFRLSNLTEEESKKEDCEFLPNNWSPVVDTYSIIYKHIQSSLTYQLKGLAFGSTIMIHGMVVEEDRVYSIKLKISDFVNSSAALNQPEIYYNDLSGLITLFRNDIVGKMISLLAKEGYESTTTTNNNNNNNITTTQTHRVYINQNQPQPPPIFQPLQQPQYGYNPFIGGGGIGGVGRNDLEPNGGFGLYIPYNNNNNPFGMGGRNDLYPSGGFGIPLGGLGGLGSMGGGIGGRIEGNLVGYNLYLYLY